MKTVIILSDGIKQIIFTPENEQEKYALALITPDDDIELLIEDGGFGNENYKPFTKTIEQCKGGWLRLYHEEHSRI